MNSKVFLAGAIVVFSALFGGFFWLLKNSETPKTPIVTTEKKSENHQIKKKKENSAPKKSQKSKNDDDFFRTAILSKNSEKCDEISDKKKAQKCRDGVASALAFQNENPEKCDEIVENLAQKYCRDQIFFLRARDQKDFSGCPKVEDAETRQKCEQLADRHLMYTAQILSDCDAIGDADLKKSCRDRFFERAKVSDRKCEKLSTQQKRRDCQIDRAAEISKKSGDISACQKLSNAADRQKCLLKVQEKIQIDERNAAISRGDVDACAMIPDPDGRIFCTERAIFVRAQNAHDVSMCDEISSKKLREKCGKNVAESATVFFVQKAKAEKNPKICEKIPDEQNQILCKKVVSP